MAWLNTTGWAEWARMSSVVRRSVCEQSRITPAALAASTMRRPQRGQTLRLVVAAARDAVVAVVGEVHLAHAKIAVQRHHLGPFEQRQSAFEVKTDREFSLVTRAFDVRYRVGQQIAFGMRGDLCTKGGDHRQDLRERVHVHAHIDAHVVHAGGAVALQWCKRGVGVQGQTGVGFPEDHVSARWRVAAQWHRFCNP